MPEQRAFYYMPDVHTYSYAHLFLPKLATVVSENVVNTGTSILFCIYNYILHFLPGFLGFYTIILSIYLWFM